MVAVAGLVPCAESGTMTFVRAVSPRDSWYALISSMPVNSPWAPAAGCTVTASMPVISPSSAPAVWMTSSAPWTVDSGCVGWICAKPGSAAASSFTRGLYFIVHDPSG